MKAPRIQFRPGEDLSKQLVERSTLHPGLIESRRDSILAETVRQELNNYYVLMKASLPRFSMNEAMLMIDAMNGCIIDAHMPQMLWANIADAVEMNGLDKKWDVDGSALIARLRELGRTNPFACWAIYDAIQRAWNSTTYRVENMEERAKQVGLVGSDQEDLQARSDEQAFHRKERIEQILRQRDKEDH